MIDFELLRSFVADCCGFRRAAQLNTVDGKLADQAHPLSALNNLQ
jgi:hypothetical protein